MDSAFLDGLRDIRGYIASALVEMATGRVVVSDGDLFDIRPAASGNAELVRAERKLLETLGIEDLLEDILITLEHQIHLIRPLESNHGLFLYLALDRKRANMALARHQLRLIDLELDFG